ncbi:GNAT family N-acetyltransferase [Actinosynnema sp. NPDC020468]|uniref:GNAT family N-acetyltransferase n=1 Tax=Actinosynnema sp. NPDC020468 TaxID=3154488 RepID=UPI0033F880BB
MDSLLPAFDPSGEPYSFTEFAPDALNATWGALRVHSLAYRPDDDLDARLRAWPLPSTDDRDTAAVVTVPSRDLTAADALARHGFAPLVVLAARPAGRVGVPSDAFSGDVRPMTGDDVEAVTAINLETVRYDGHFGMVNERPSTEGVLRGRIAGLLERDEPCSWVAEVDGRVVGALNYDLPGHSEWVAGRTSVRPVAYVGLLGVLPSFRGGGVGGALAAVAHERLDAAGVGVTLLHHAAPNPRSTPFWYSQGYRPLWTSWQRRPC